jgi:hypothetical protein
MAGAFVLTLTDRIVQIDKAVIDYLSIQHHYRTQAITGGAILIGHYGLGNQIGE